MRGPGAWRRTAGVAFVAAAFLFLAIFLVDNLAQLRAHEWEVRPELLASSILLQAVGLASGAIGWHRLLRRMDVRVPVSTVARILFVAGLTRYIPGKIWPFIGAARLAGPAGVPRGVVIASLAAHTVFSLIGAMVIAAIFLPLDVIGLGFDLAQLRWLAPLLLLLAHPFVIDVALRLVRRLTGQHVGDWSGTWIDGLLLVAISMAGWLLTGAALHAFIGSLTPLPADAFTDVLGFNALAFVLGQLFFIAPAGLGAKEGTLAALLSLHLALPVAALLAVSVRLWSTLAEIILATLLLIAAGRRRTV